MRLLLTVLLVALPAMARQRLQGSCAQGGYQVTISGSSSINYFLRSFPKCTVEVFNAGTVVHPTNIYSDNIGTVKTNPFVSDQFGYWFFYADNARYDVRLSGAGIPSPFTLGDWLLFDNASAGGITSLNGLIGATQTFGNDTNVTITSAGTAHTLGWLGTLSVTRGGSGAGTFTTNGVLLGNGTSAFGVTSAGSADQVFRIPSAGGAPAFGQINLAAAAAVTGQLPIASGGTGQATVAAAFNALSPLTTKGDILTHNGIGSIRLGVGANGLCIQADSTQAVGWKWASCLGATPLPITSGGTGTATLTGVLIGNGTSAFTAVAASAQRQFARRKPNVSGVVYELAGPHWLLATDFDFPAQTPGGTLTGGVGASATLSPCPLGLNGADTAHYIYISGGVGTAEVVLVTGGTCTTGAATGTITFTPANNHSGGWAVTSATQGVQEAICFSPSGDNRVIVPAGTSTLNANVGLCGVTNIIVQLSNGLTLAGTGTFFAQTATAWIDDQRSRGMQGHGPCSKYTIPYTNAAFITNGTTADVTLFTLSQYGKILLDTIKHSVSYSDGAGAMTDVSVSVGDSSSNTAFSAASSIGEATAPGDTVFLDTAPNKSTTMAAAGRSVFAHFIATGANFGDGSKTALIAGSVDIWVCWGTIQ